MTAAASPENPPPTLPRMHLYIAAVGRSGSTLIANWFTLPPRQLVLLEPELPKGLRHRSLMRQLEGLGRPVSEAEWAAPDASPARRIARILGPRLEGSSWGVKEVKAPYHAPMIATFTPAKVLLSVRNVRNVVLSFREKHRLQGIDAVYDAQWVRRHCIEAARTLVALRERLARDGGDFACARYEDFIASDATRRGLAEFLAWDGGGDVGRGLDAFNRAEELRRHGARLTPVERDARLRGLDAADVALADEVAEACAGYQAEFGYR